VKTIKGSGFVPIIHILLVILVLLFFSPFKAEARGGSGRGYSSRSSHSSVHVKSYTKKDGTHVQAHNRSRANGTTQDNWSHKGNVNPYTGKVGSKND